LWEDPCKNVSRRWKIHRRPYWSRNYWPIEELRCQRWNNWKRWYCGWYSGSKAV
uniref:Envelope glycoprotein n=1 Tax=Haemonchus placei TaxID=6290 RepID=A0A0N4X8E4_HAEPC